MDGNKMKWRKVKKVYLNRKSVVRSETIKLSV